MSKVNDFNESEFQTVVQAAYFHHFRHLTDFDFHIPSLRKERELGYDFKIRRGIPLYLQFKVSKFYSSKSTSSDYRNRKAKLGVNNKPKYSDNSGAFYFELHLDKKTNGHRQHNKLYQFGRNNFYAAPLFTKREKLYDCLRYWTKINKFGNFNMPFILDFANNRTFFQSVLRNHFLNDVIYIRPHKEIKDKENHKYIYNDAFETSFHSDNVEEVDNARPFFYHLQSFTNINTSEDIKTFEQIALTNAKVILGEKEDSQSEDSRIAEIRTLSLSNKDNDKKKLLGRTINYLSEELGIINLIVEM